MPPYGAQSYARTYQAQAVLTASPGQLILILFDGAIRFMGLAIDALKEPTQSPRSIEQAHTNLVKTQNIIAELQSSLNLEAGGEYAANLDRLYDYYLRRLQLANLKKDAAPVIEVENLVRQLRDGWAEMLRTQASATAAPIRGVA
jgi:flagellar secretion chaperone FliS